MKPTGDVSWVLALISKTALAKSNPSKHVSKHTFVPMINLLSLDWLRDQYSSVIILDIPACKY